MLALAGASVERAAAQTTAGKPDVLTCQDFVELLPASLASAAEVVVAVTLEQGGLELAYERSKIVRDDEGRETATTLERRGLRRPDRANRTPGGSDGDDGDAFDLPCDRHDIALSDEGEAVMQQIEPYFDQPQEQERRRPVYNMRTILVKWKFSSDSFLHVFSDITSLKELEHEKVTNKCMHIMFASLSHEFRTPLNSF